MIIKYQNAMSASQSVNATGIVIYDNLGNPIAVFYELANRLLTMSLASSPDFKDKLQQVGIRDSAQVVTLETGGGQLRFHE